MASARQSASIAWIIWKLRDGLAELLALGGIAHALFDQALGDADADRGNVQAAAVEHLHGDAEALALFAQAVFDRHADVVEIDVADMGALLAHLLLGLADRDAVEIARHQEALRRRRRLSRLGSVRAITVNSEARLALVM